MNYIPLGKRFTQLAKTYVGLVATELQHIDIERYYYVLFVLHQSETLLTQKELGCLVYSDKTNMVRILDYLQSHNCLVREANTEDRRSQFIKLTPKGQELAVEIERVYKRIDSFFMDTLHENETKSLINKLQNIANNMEHAADHYVTLNFKTHKKQS